MYEVIEEFKKYVREKFEYKRFDVEMIDKEMENDKEVRYMGRFYVEDRKGDLSIVWDKRFGGKEVSGKEKEGLWKVLCLGENEVLNCGKVGESKSVGIGCICVCVWYEEGREKWNLSDYGYFEKFDGDDKWRKVRNG